MKELLLLKLRNLIAEKEMNTASANRATTQFGEWNIDYYGQSCELSNEIDNLIKEIESVELKEME